MTVLVTTTGAAHVAERLAGSVLTNTFDALEFGQGLNVPTVADNRFAMTAKIGGLLVQVDEGYPVLGDADVRNDGRADDVWSWRFSVPETVEVLASNAIVTNYRDGAPLASEPILVHARQTAAKRSDEAMTVFVNVSSAGAGTMVTHVTPGALLPQQVMGWTDRGALASGQPGSHQRGAGDLFSPAREGQPVVTMWFLRKADGEPIRRDDVSHAWASVSVMDTENRWTHLYDVTLSVPRILFNEPQRRSQLWRAGGGFYGAWTFEPGGGHGARRTRLEINMQLHDRTTRTVVHEVEYRPIG